MDIETTRKALKARGTTPNAELICKEAVEIED
jgi:hypothetical protein